MDDSKGYAQIDTRDPNSRGYLTPNKPGNENSVRVANVTLSVGNTGSNYIGSRKPPAGPHANDIMGGPGSHGPNTSVLNDSFNNTMLGGLNSSLNSENLPLCY